MIPALTTAVACISLLASGRSAAGEPIKSIPSSKLYKVKTFRKITYQEVLHGPERERHQLDVFCPKEETGRPVLFFIHGGGWMIGGKDNVFGIYGYSTIARCLAQRGLVVVLPNYRLSPGVKHPEHMKDVARAFAWTCQNIGRYGGDRKQIFVAGHSAGGHLVSLLATDPTYLKEAGRSAKDIQGVIAISGIYRVEVLDLQLSVSTPCMKASARVRPFALAFGTDPKVLKQASPITHIRPGLPPFLLLSAGFDYCPLRQMTKDFAAALEENDCDVEIQVVPWRTHETLVFDILHQTAEPKMIEAVVNFIDRCRASPRQ